jgi:hypothetical protein
MIGSSVWAYLLIVTKQTESEELKTKKDKDEG